MLFERLIYFLLTPFAFFPKAVHLLIDLLGIIFAHKIVEFLNLLFSLEMRQQPEEIHLSPIQSYILCHIS